MHFCKNIRTVWVCWLSTALGLSLKAKSLFTQRRALLLFLLLPMAVHATPAQINVKNVELVAVEDKFHLNMDLDFQFNTALEDALNKGVPLTFLYEFQLSQPRKYWFDEEVVTHTQRVTISYHALSRQYLINRQQHQQSFANFAQAKEALSKIKDWMVFDKSVLKKGEQYQAALRVRLDQSRLPKALQAEAASSEDWAMYSERMRWVPSLNP
ncbi:MAG: DUF4390 domain-containing protein [Candidatus Methylopumilus sp.]|nr:DUF4390 domain-containing protein [Candidatus Methylopumilus sp.]